MLKFLFDDKNLTQNPRGKEKRRGRRVKTKGRIEGQAGEREIKEVNKKEENQFVKKKTWTLCPCFQDYELPICDICTPFY